MSQLGQSLQKSDVRVTSAYPSISDMIVQRQERRKGPCVDGSKLARRIFTSQAWSVHKKFLKVVREKYWLECHFRLLFIRLQIEANTTI